MVKVMAGLDALLSVMGENAADVTTLKEEIGTDIRYCRSIWIIINVRP